jgi:hypothetical protein
LFSGRWVILHQDTDVQSDEFAAVNPRPSLDDFYPLERQAFEAPAAGP